MESSQATRLRAILDARGRGSIGDLADKTGVTREHLSRIANGHGDASWALKQKIAAVLGLKVSELWPPED